MKKLFILIIICSSFTFAQRGKVAVTPGLYYTMGSYSNNISSSSISAYGVFDFGFQDRIVVGYDKLNIDIKDYDWVYNQNFFVISGTKNLYPFYLKLDYGHAGGEYEYGDVKDAMEIFHLSTLYNFELFYAGVNWTFGMNSGYYKLNTNYIESRLLWTPSLNFNITIMPGYTLTDDNRNEISFGAELFYAPIDFMNISIRGFIGDRVTYYNSDYQTIYNQIESQSKGVTGIVRLFASGPFNIIGAYQYRDFTDYTINYITIGAKLRID